MYIQALIPAGRGEELAERFDELPVDVKSLMAYIHWLRTGVNRKKPACLLSTPARKHTLYWRLPESWVVATCNPRSPAPLGECTTRG